MFILYATIRSLIRLYTHHMRNTIFTVILLFTVFFGFSQKCLTDYHYEQYQKAHPELQYEFDKLAHIQDYVPQQKTNGVTRIIPVVFHVIHEYGPENISKAQIDDAIRILNEDYRKLNPDTTDTRAVFKPYAADCSIEFRLAKIDPNGNCTQGIDRIYSPLTNDAGDNVKALSWWNNSKYLNIWTVKSIAGSGSGTILGYSQFPGGGSATTDGIIVRNDCVGRIGTEPGNGFGEYGRTLTHEIGHSLALFHTFQGSCNGGDQVSDTPPVSTANYGCVLTTNSCTNFSSPYLYDVPDMLENYMDYTNGTCQSLFTGGQKTRIDAALSQYRSNLYSAANLASTGVDGNGPISCTPVADFIANKIIGCSGTNFSFTDLSYNGTITNWNWTFTGASTPNSTDQNPNTISWSTAGTYSVSLTVSNAAGNNTKTRTSYITISALQATSTVPVVQGFENATIQSDGWTLENGGNATTWQRITSSKRSGAACFYINHYNATGTASGDVDAFYSKSYSLTNVTKPVINFYTAYAQRISGVNDVLKMYISIDCGQTWQVKISKIGNTLAGGVAMNANSYVPQATDWILQQYDLISYAGIPNIRFRFETTSREGNNIYIDDINVVNAQDGINQTAPTSDIGLTLNPNPFTQEASITFVLNKPSLVSIKIIDMLGKEMIRSEFEKFEAGTIAIPIKMQHVETLAGSVYFVTITVDGITYSRKLIRL